MVAFCKQIMLSFFERGINQKKKKEGNMNLKHRIEAYWDQRAATYDEMRRQHLHGPEFRFWYQELEDHLPDGSLHILDIGTGTGFLAVIAASLGHWVTAIDLSEEMLNKARQASCEFQTPIRFLKMDADHLDFPEASFDAVLCRNTIWTAENPQKIYQEIYRVLKPEGCFLNYDADYGKMRSAENVQDPELRALLKECDAYKALLEISHVRRPEWDIEILRKTGFVHCECMRNISRKLAPHGAGSDRPKEGAHTYKTKRENAMFFIYAVKPACTAPISGIKDFALFYRHSQLFYRENRLIGNNRDTSFFILDLLCRQPEGLRSIDMTEHLHIPKQTITRLVSQLQADGYICQDVNPRDKRSILFFATPAGHDFYNLLAEERLASYRRILARFPAEKMEQLNQLYEAFLNAF